MKRIWYWLLLSKILFIASLSPAAPSCHGIFEGANPRVLLFFDADPIKQWLKWEQQSNFVVLKKPTDPAFVPVAKINAATVNVKINPEASKNLRALIQTGDVVSWFKHPDNSHPEIPNYHTPTHAKLVTFYSASRSMILNWGSEVYSLKMGTNRPHGPGSFTQSDKIHTREDINDGIQRMAYIEAVEKKIGTDPMLILAKEVVFVADKLSGDGYMIRDLSFMKDGHYYLPAFSLPYAGREIADFLRKNPDTFWRQHYAAVLGKAKARLLLRYGLQMETPNPQNILIQLDLNMMPTGKIVFRDLSDTVLVESFAKALGEGETLTRDQDLGVENTNKFHPYWQNSAMHLDRNAGPSAFYGAVLAKWAQAHDAAYIQELEEALGLKLKKFGFIDGNSAFKAFMESPEAQGRIRAYRESLEKQHSAAAQE